MNLVPGGRIHAIVLAGENQQIVGLDDTLTLSIPRSRSHGRDPFETLSGRQIATRVKEKAYTKAKKVSSTNLVK